jgi:hypothetical protein
VAQSLKIVPLCLAVAAAVAACGGSGNDLASPATTVDRPEGIYGGTLTGSASPDFRMLVLENGELWSFYGTETAPGYTVGGLVQGAVTVSGTTFVGTDLRDYGVAPATSGTTAGSFNKAAGTITGNVVAGGVTVSFSGAPIAGSLYNYDTPASLASFTGAWTLDSLDGDNITLNVTAGGAVTATTVSGCTFSGTAAPRASGKNVFDINVTFGAAPCLLANQNASGIALAYPISGGAQTQLLVALQNATRLAGNAAYGVR